MADAVRETEATISALIGHAAGAERRLIEAMRYASLNGGKRLRGFLVLESAGLFGVPPDCGARVAASVEMLHAYSLVHDDLPAMDDDDLRRGSRARTASSTRRPRSWPGTRCRPGRSRCWREPATHADPQARCELVLALGLGCRRQGHGGRADDRHGVRRPHARSAGGGAVAGAEDRAADPVQRRGGGHPWPAGAAARAQIAAYGRDLGAAFQIADDVLDAAGDTAAIGKTAGKDAAAGKATLVALLGLERAPPKARRLSEQAASHLDSFGAGGAAAAGPCELRRDAGPLR